MCAIQVINQNPFTCGLPVIQSRAIPGMLIQMFCSSSSLSAHTVANYALFFWAAVLAAPESTWCAFCGVQFTGARYCIARGDVRHEHRLGDHRANWRCDAQPQTLKLSQATLAVHTRPSGAICQQLNWQRQQLKPKAADISSKRHASFKWRQQPWWWWQLWGQ